MEAKLTVRTSAAAYNRELAIYESYRLCDGTTAFQAEIASINEAANEMQSMKH